LKEHSREAERWLLQAENDFAFAELGLKEGFFAQVCFQSQQVCEKALKSVHYGALRKRVVFGHSLVELAADLEISEDLRQHLAILDQYYIPTRYPNGLPGALPYEVYTRAQAETAVSTCREVIALARASLQRLG
jgi:HEPN domain-containing protein